MKILLTAKQRASVNALIPIAAELEHRNHVVTKYATGNEAEAANFGTHLQPTPEQYDSLVLGYDAVVTGLSGFATPDGYFLRAAHTAGIPTIGVLDINLNYALRLSEVKDVPTILAVMNEECLSRMGQELVAEVGAEVVKRARVVGWTAYDHCA